MSWRLSHTSIRSVALLGWPVRVAVALAPVHVAVALAPVLALVAAMVLTPGGAMYLTAALAAPAAAKPGPTSVKTAGNPAAGNPAAANPAAVNPAPAKPLAAISGAAKPLAVTSSAAKAAAKPQIGPASFADKTTDDLMEEARDLARDYKHMEADLLLEEAVRRQPKNARFRFILGKGLIEEGRFSKAIEEFLEASLLDPTHNGARFEIAQVYVYQGRFKDAVTVLEQIKSRVSFTSRDARKADKALNSIAAYYELGDPYSASYADPEESTPWQRSDFPIKVAIWSDPEMRDLKAPFRRAVIDAFTRWKEASGGWLRFQIVDDQRQAKIVCKLVGVMRGNKYEGGGEKLGETLGDYDNKNADVLGFSRVEIFWDEEESNPAHLRTTVLHEVGHALGLGHSNNPLDVMYPFVHPPYTEFPSRRDASSIRALYKIKS